MCTGKLQTGARLQPHKLKSRLNFNTVYLVIRGCFQRTHAHSIVGYLPWQHPRGRECYDSPWGDGEEGQRGTWLTFWDSLIPAFGTVTRLRCSTTSHWVFHQLHQLEPLIFREQYFPDCSTSANQSTVLPGPNCGSGIQHPRVLSVCNLVLDLH